MASSSDPNVLTVLRKACKASGLPHTGNKATLIARLSEHQSGKDADAADDSAMQDDNVTIPTDFYEATKKELLVAGIYDPKKLHDEIVQQYKFQLSEDDEAADDGIITLPAPLNDSVRKSQKLVFVDVTDQGEFRYKKQPEVAVKPGPPAGSSAPGKAAASTMMPPKKPPPKMSGAISKAAGKKPKPPSDSSLKAMLQKAKEVEMDAPDGEAAVGEAEVDAAPAAEDGMEKKVSKAAVMQFISQRLMDKAQPVHVTAMLGDFMPTVPPRGTTKEYCECLALALLEDSDSDE